MDIYSWLVEHRDVLMAVSALFAIGSFISSTVRSFFGNVLNFLFGFVPVVHRARQLRKYVKKDPHKFPLWRYRPRGRPSKSKWPTLITVMNFKGGVGKTTLTANLAASLVSHKNLNVWVVDLDYQGSLSYMAKGIGLSGIELAKNSNQMGDILSAPDKKSLKEIKPSQFFEGFEKAKIITANHDLAEIEDNQLQKWLLHMNEPSGDVRSKIAHWLNQIKSEVDLPDIILFDAPPRISLSAINALAISDFLLVPTLPQPASIEPISKLFERITRMREVLHSKLVIMGVVFNLASSSFDTTDEADDNILRVNRAFEKLPPEARPKDGNYVFKSTIPRAAAISEPGQRLAYADPRRRAVSIKSRFDDLADELVLKLNEYIPGGKF